MKMLWFMLVVIFVIITLGIVDVKISFTDGTTITHRSWLHLFHKK
jgi:hypothetical protein